MLELFDVPRLTVEGSGGIGTGEAPRPDPPDGIRPWEGKVGAVTDLIVIAGPRIVGGEEESRSGEDGRALLGDVVGEPGDPERRWLGRLWEAEVA